jgi:hypothetical protein
MLVRPNDVPERCFVMPLAYPQFVVLDSSTLGNVSRDYWSPNKSLRDKAHTFVARLRDQNVYITLTLTHVLEILGHENESVVRDRLLFMRGLPFIAWLRPYDRHWFPGGIPDLLRYELYAVVHDGKRNWPVILDQARINLWETGLGREMFVDDDNLWSTLRTESQHQKRNEQYVASVARTDPGNINGLTLGEVKQLPERPKEERIAFMQRFATTMKVELDQHGDLRLDNRQEVAASFANDRLQNVALIEAAGSDPIQRLLEFHGVPPDLVTDDMTVGDIGLLAVYIKQLKIISEGLNARTTITVHDVPPNTLPSYVLAHELSKIQRKAIRVSGSDLGDGHIAPLVLYADSVEVDKRTCEHLTQVKRACPAIAGLMGHFFRSADYAEIPDRCESAV